MYCVVHCANWAGGVLEKAVDTVKSRFKKSVIPKTLLKFKKYPWNATKVGKSLKGGLDLIPSPSVKIQIMGEKFAWGIKQNIAGHCQQTFCFQKFVDIAQRCFAFKPQTNFPAHYLNFYWRWRDQIQATF